MYIRLGVLRVVSAALLLFTTHTAEYMDMPLVGAGRPFLELREAGTAGPPSNKGPLIMRLLPVRHWSDRAHPFVTPAASR